LHLGHTLEADQARDIATCLAVGIGDSIQDAVADGGDRDEACLDERDHDACGVAPDRLVDTLGTGVGELSEAQTQVTDAFFLADMVVVASSALSAVAIWNRWPSALLLTAFTAGGVVYPTVYLLAWVSSTDGRGTAPLALMLAVSTLTLWALSGVWRSSRQPSGISSHH
jgi:hypothetical protein